MVCVWPISVLPSVVPMSKGSISASGRFAAGKRAFLLASLAFTKMWQSQHMDDASVTYRDYLFGHKARTVLHLPLVDLLSWNTIGNVEARQRIQHAINHCLPDFLGFGFYHCRATDKLLVLLPRDASYPPVEFTARVQQALYLVPPWGYPPAPIPLFQCPFCWQFLTNCEAAMDHIEYSYSRTQIVTPRSRRTQFVESRHCSPTCTAFLDTCNLLRSNPLLLDQYPTAPIAKVLRHSADATHVLLRHLLVEGFCLLCTKCAAMFCCETCYLWHTTGIDCGEAQLPRPLLLHCTQIPEPHIRPDLHSIEKAAFHRHLPCKAPGYSAPRVALWVRLVNNCLLHHWRTRPIFKSIVHILQQSQELPDSVLSSLSEMIAAPSLSSHLLDTRPRRLGRTHAHC